MNFLQISCKFIAIYMEEHYANDVNDDVKCL